MRWLVYAVVLFSSQSLFGADTGPISLTVAQQIDGPGTQAWTIPGSGGLASSTGWASQQSEWLWLGGGDFSSIPAGATIDGVVVSVTRQSNDGMVDDASVAYIVKGGAVVGGGLFGGLGNWPVSASAASFGGATDLGGTTLTRDDVVGQFGTAVQCAFSGMYSQGTVVSATATVYYTVGTTSPDVEWWERSDCLIAWLLALHLGVALYQGTSKWRSSRVGRGISA